MTLVKVLGFSIFPSEVGQFFLHFTILLTIIESKAVLLDEVKDGGREVRQDSSC
jgi:hypothetical protein